MIPKYFTPKPEAVEATKDGREICNQKLLAGRVEYRRRTLEMLYRQRFLCPICGKALREEEATFEHEDLRGMGGARRDDRIWVNGEPQNFAVHGLCNTEKGSRRDVIRHHDYERTYEDKQDSYA